MVPNGLITQIALIGLSVGIFLTYLQPSFVTVRESQDKLALYKSEREKVQGVNARLDTLVKDEATISAGDRALLDRFLPQTVDAVSVQRDILAIFDTIGIVPTALTADDAPANKNTSEATADGVISNAPALVAHGFSTAASLRYEETLELLRLFEVNAYPLDVITMDIAAAGGDAEGEDSGIPGALTVNFEMATYAFTHATSKTE